MRDTDFYSAEQAYQIANTEEVIKFFSDRTLQDVQPQIINTTDKAEKFIREVLYGCAKGLPVAWDWETTGVQYDSKWVGLGCSWGLEPDQCAYIPLTHVDPKLNWGRKQHSKKEYVELVKTTSDPTQSNAWDLFSIFPNKFLGELVPGKRGTITKASIKEANKQYKKWFLESEESEYVKKFIDGYIVEELATTGNEVYFYIGEDQVKSEYYKVIKDYIVTAASNKVVDAKLIPIKENLDERVFVDTFSGYFKDENCKKVFHNEKYDLRFFFYNELDPIEIKGVVADTMVLSYVLKHDRYSFSESKVTHSLKPLSRDLLEINKQDFPGEIAPLPIEQAASYCCDDTHATLKLYSKFSEELELPENQKLKTLYEQVEHPLIELLAETEIYGLPYDEEWFKAEKPKKENELEQIQNNIKQQINKPYINLSSTKQMNDLLFVELGLQPHKLMQKGKSGLWSLDKKVFPHFVSDNVSNHPWLADILKMRSLKHDITTKLIGVNKHVNKTTRRLHPQFIQAGAEVGTDTGTDTGRLSSNKPNVQNLPKWAKGWLIADPGMSLLEFDYSGFELRILLHYTRDPQLEEAMFFKFPDTGKADPHRYVAQLLFERKLSPDDPDFKTLRHIAKQINFGIVYGMGGSKLFEMLLIQGIPITIQKANRYIQKYGDILPIVSLFMMSCHLEIIKTGYLETVLGRRRYFNLESENWYKYRKVILDKVTQFLDPFEESSIESRKQIYKEIMELGQPTKNDLGCFRQGGNFKLQGSNADYNKLAEIRIRNHFKEVGIQCSTYCRVHDALGFQIPEQYLIEAAIDIKHIAESTPALSYPTPVELSTGKRWSELEKLSV